MNMRRTLPHTHSHMRPSPLPSLPFLLLTPVAPITSPQEVRVDADAVDYNAHHWRVHLRGLAPATPLGIALGMEDVTVVVELSFREELYPFYPPTVTLKSPRMQVRIPRFLRTRGEHTRREAGQVDRSPAVRTIGMFYHGRNSSQL
jgi:hypothetical protein